MNRIILDVEATGTFNRAKVYDLGGQVVDENLNVIEKFNFVIEEIFFNDNLMKNAYYAEKIPAYYDDIKNGVREIVPFAIARANLLVIAKKYNVKQLWAFNANYDKNALEFTSKMILNRSFIPENMNLSFFCIMGASFSTVCNSINYCKFAERTPSGRVRVNAENVYRYISGNYDFVEEHTGLKDAIIETEILKACLRYHRKMDTEPKNLNCFSCYWEIQKKAKNL